MSRILTMQRQARELGRLRNGYTDGTRPVKSETWVVSSHAEHYVQAAAAEWGGNPEKWQPLGGGAQQWRVITAASSIDAILPPGGDPLSQTYEMWSGGGCQRRCDGVTELLADAPCLCPADPAERTAAAAKGRACKATTRLNVILPAMPDIGVWRLETHSYWAANEIAGAVDLVLSGTGGRAVVPIRLRLEPRSVKRSGEGVKWFIVPVVEIRGVTAGQIVAGQIPAASLERGVPLVELPPAEPTTDTVTDYVALAGAATTTGELSALWRQAKADGVLTDGLRQLLVERGTVIAPPPPPDVDTLWARIVATCPVEWSTTQLETEFTAHTGSIPSAANTDIMAGFLAHLGSGAAQ